MPKLQTFAFIGCQMLIGFTMVILYVIANIIRIDNVVLFQFIISHVLYILFVFQYDVSVLKRPFVASYYSIDHSFGTVTYYN